MWPKFSKEEIDSVTNILSSGKVNYWTGEECKKFEKEFSEYFGIKYSITLANGTVALDIALKALGIGEGDEVIVTSRTFIASVSSIVNAGAIPIFCDVSKNSQNLDTSQIKRNLSSRTKAILCVHLAGWPCEMDEIIDIANENNIFVIEDCAQSHGGKYKGKFLGSIGDIGCWSFCQDKIMTTLGEGGMVTTNNESLWRKMWAYKDHGKSYAAVYENEHPPGFKWLHESFGTNWRMTEVQGAVGRIQLKLLPEWTKKRNQNQARIWSIGSKLRGIRVPNFICDSCDLEEKTSCCVHAAYKCYLFVQPEDLKPGWDRDRIIEEINLRGVDCFSGTCSEVYLEKAFDNTDYRPNERLPIAKELGETSLMFLVHPTLNDQEIEKTCLALNEVMSLASDQK